MSIDELPEEQLDHILRYFLCDSERQGDGDTPQSWLRVPVVRLVCTQCVSGSSATPLTATKSS